MDQKYASLALHLLTVVLLAVIAFELANPAKAPVYAPSNVTDYSSSLQSISRQLDQANSYLKDICTATNARVNGDPATGQKVNAMPAPSDMGMDFGLSCR